MDSMPRFVLLYHECPADYVRPSHWDLMLEQGDALRTWALTRLPRNWQPARSRTADSHSNCPTLADENTVAAEQLGDHRLAYLRDEGPLSGNRGTVRRVDEGTYETIAETPGTWSLRLTGALLSGSIRLQFSQTQWTLTSTFET
jgi:hypothetical protein